VIVLWAILALVFFGVAAGFSLLGQGGGVLYTPVQVLAGIEFHVAATTSLFLIMIVSLSSTLVFRRAGRVDWPLAITLESVTMLGGFVGGLSSGHFAGSTLSLLFALVVACAAFFMIRSVRARPRCPERDGTFVWRRERGGQVYCVVLPLALSVSFLAGALSGLVGVGGGILKVPMMVLLFGIPMEIAVGSSAFMIGLTALGGFAGHVASGHFDWKTSLILAAVVFVGGQIGARHSLKLDRRKIQTIFGWFLLCIALLMAGRALA